MALEIMPYAADLAESVTSFYNEAVEDVPYCHPVDPETLDGILTKSVRPSRRFTRLHDEIVAVACEEGSVVGFIHAGGELSRKARRSTKRGVICCFLYRRGRRLAAQGLLDAAEAHLTEIGKRDIQVAGAEYRYPFHHMPNAALSNHLGRVQGLLGVNGYRRDYGEIFFSWPDFDPPEPSPVDFDLAYTLEWKQLSGARPGLYLQSHLGDQQVGEFGCVCAGDGRKDESLQEWLFVEWLGINEAFQGEGIGKHRLQRGLREGYDKGYRHAIISTATDNWRAYTLYSNWGFRTVDWTFDFKKKLSD
jgi:GNAT superfamily N-acetyltransferase